MSGKLASFIRLTGDTNEDLLLALVQVQTLLNEEYLSGFGSSESSSYNFEVCTIPEKS